MSANPNSQSNTQPQRGYFFPLYWPFTIPGWLSRLWWLILLDYVPGINLIFLRGWRLAVVRRMAWKQDAALPALHPFRYLWHGAFLWTLTFCYTFVPIIAIAVLGFGGVADFFRDIQTLWRIFTGQESMTFWQFVKSELRDTVMSLVIEMVWIAVSLPLHRAAMIRFAVTGAYRSFLNVPANALFILQNFGSFLSVWFFSFIVGVVMIAASGLLALTVIGVVLIPIVTLPMYYWSSAYEYGELAFKLRTAIYPNAEPPARISQDLI